MDIFPIAMAMETVCLHKQKYPERDRQTTDVENPLLTPLWV